MTFQITPQFWYYLVQVVLLFVGILITLIVQKIPRYKIYIQTEEWHKYNYPYSGATIGYEYLLLYGLVASIIMSLVIIYDRLFVRKYECKYVESKHGQRALLSGKNPKSRFHEDAFDIIMGTLFAPTIALFMCEVLKVFGNRLRPNYLARCSPRGFDRLKPDYSALGPNPQCLPEAESDIKTSLVDDGAKSFPSSHTMCVFSIHIYFLLTMNRLLSRHESKYWSWLRLLLNTVTLLLPFWVGMSRVLDHDHHPSDVVFGGIFGILVGFITYYLVHSRDYEMKYVLFSKKQEYDTKENLLGNKTGMAI